MNGDRVLLRVALATALVVGGCGGARSAARGDYADRSPSATAPTAVVNVRLALPADVSKPSLHSAGEGLREAGKMTGKMLVTGGAATLIAGPAGAATAVVGAGLALLLAPVFIVEGAVNGAQRAAVLRAIEAMDFPSRLGATLERRLDRSDRLRVDVVIRNYGFVGGGQRLCFIASLDVEALVDERRILQEEIVMGHGPKSDDVPPPECGELADIAADDGRVARRVLRDASEILAAVIAKRLRAAR